MGSSDYTDYVQKWPKVKRNSELKSSTVSINLNNHEGNLNSIYEDTYNSITQGQLSIGIPSNDQAADVYSGSAKDVLVFSDYIILANSGNIAALEYNVGSGLLSLVGSYGMGDAGLLALSPTSNYIFVVDSSTVQAVTFTGSGFNLEGSFPTGSVQDIEASQSSCYLYATKAVFGIRAYSFSGSEFTEAGSYAPPAFSSQGVCGGRRRYNICWQI